MMLVELSTGRLRLGGHHLDALLRGLGSPFAPVDAESGPAAAELDAAWTELVDAGVVTTAGQPAEAFAGTFATLAAPWLAVQVGLVGAGGENAHQVWAGPTQGVAAAHVRDGWYDLIPIGPGGVPAAVARLCSLGPRPRVAEGEALVAADVLDAFVSARDTGPDGAAASRFLPRLDRWPAVAAAVRAGDWRIVQVSADWAPGLFAGAEEAAASSMSLLLLDTPGGLLLLVPGAEDVMLQAATPTDVWQLLVSITRPPADLVLDSPFALASR
nr:hypothetical protein [Propionicimonas sp.]